MKIGVLFPVSTLRPLLTKRILAGIKQALNKQNVSYELCQENIGSGTDAKKVNEAAQNLILYKEVDFIIALVGSRVIESLAKLMEQHEQSLVLLDMGAHPWIYKQTEKYEHTFFYSYGVWESTYQLGLYAGQSKANNKFLVSSSFLNCGYPIAMIFQNGLDENGGTILGYKLQSDDYAKIDYNAILQAAIDVGATGLLALYEGDSLMELLEERDKQNADHLAIFTLGVLLDNKKIAALEKHKNVVVIDREQSIEDADAIENWTSNALESFLNKDHKSLSRLSPQLIQTSLEGSIKQESLEPEKKERTKNYLTRLSETSVSSGWENPFLFI
jgi:ABC-type branched-subunit amino acid transport system substrate-binding protein